MVMFSLGGCSVSDRLLLMHVGAHFLILMFVCIRSSWLLLHLVGLIPSRDHNEYQMRNGLHPWPNMTIQPVPGTRLRPCLYMLGA